MRNQKAHASHPPPKGRGLPGLNVKKYLANPTPNSWSNINGIIINSRGKTIWQAIIAIDPSFPTTGRRIEFSTGKTLKEWDRIPEPEIVLKAINAFTEF